MKDAFCFRLRLFAVIGAGAFLCFVPLAEADGRNWTVEVEGGAAWFGRNDVQIPGDTGTRFDLRDLTGKGPEPYFRVAAEYRFAARHALRALAAPLRVSGTGTLAEPVDFAGEAFAAGVPTRGIYQFNNYRLTYRFTVQERERWGWAIGAVAFIRDAKVELQQPGIRGRDTDLGFVPLAHLSAWWHIAPQVSLDFQLEGLAASQGRAFDGALAFRYHPSDRWNLGVGYRMLEGGVDNDDVYSFALVHHGFLTAQLRF
jgi:hypothetical protein